MNLKALVVAGLCVVAAAPAPAEPASTRGYELADAYFRRGNFSSAYLVGLPAAHAGDPRAQYMLGLMSFHGLGPVTRNLAESARWFSLAAARGHGDSQFALAQAYAKGDGVPVDRRRSLQWLERAAVGGHTPSMMSLARLHDEGLELPRSRERATQWVRHAAELGDTRAQALLSERLRDGIGAAADPEAAKAWNERALAAGEPIALVRRAQEVNDVPDARRADLIDAYAAASYAEQRAEGDTRLAATRLKGELARKLTPSDMTEAGEKVAEWRARQPK
jgi:TPR repeat protein